jgi:hypothetical protein
MLGALPPGPAYPYMCGSENTGKIFYFSPKKLNFVEVLEIAPLEPRVVTRNLSNVSNSL